jgi:ribosomal protein S13
MSKEIENLEESSVTAGAKSADPQKKLENDGSSLGGVQDLGGPTPQNSKPDDESNKYKVVAGGSATAPTTKPSDASSSQGASIKKEETEEGDEVIAEEEETEVLHVDLSADVAALTEGEELSEEFKQKAATIFEAAVITRLNEELERLHEDYAKVLEEEIETVKSELAEQVDEYLTYAVQRWVKDNELAIEHGIKTEMAESVLTGLKQVFAENYIDISDEKVDLVDEMMDQLDIMETKLNEQIEENVELNREIGGYIKNGIVNEISEGLSLTQKEKLAALAEAVEFDDEDTFREKVATLRESYFSTKPEVTTVTEDVEVENENVSGPMSAYVQALSRWAK